MEDFKEVVVKPHFNFIRLFFSYGVSPITSVFLIFNIIVIMGFILGEIEPAIVFLIFASIFFAIILITEFAIFMNYRATTYTISKDKIVFNEGFINHQTTSIKIKNIKEIHLTQSFVQRWFKLGTIRILTAGSNMENGGGLKIQDVFSSATLYTFLNRLLKSTMNESSKIEVDKSRVISLKPDSSSFYYTLCAMAISIPIFIFFGLIATSLFGFWAEAGFNINLIIIPILILIPYIIFVAIIRMLYTFEYKNRKYLVTSTKLESKEGFFNYHYTTIDIRNIKEVRLERGFFQRKFGLGSIIVSTPANNPVTSKVNESNIFLKLFVQNNNAKQMNYYNPGIRMNNLKDALNIYKTIKYLNDYTLSKDARNMENDTPQYTYKPTFKLFAQASLYPVALFVLLWSLFSLLGGIFWFLFNLLTIGFIFLFLPLYLKKKNYDCSKYEIYPTRIEFHEGFIKNKSSMVLLDNVKEIHVRENIIQKMFKLSTIRIVTSGTTEEISMNDSGEVFRDIINGQEVYATLKKLLEEYKKEKEVVKSIANTAETGSSQSVATLPEGEENITPAVTERPPIEQMTIKPKFNFLNIMLGQFFIIFAVIITLLFFMVIQAEDFSLAKYLYVFSIGIIVSAVISFIISIFISIGDGLNYRKTTYEFQEDKVNFTEGFFNNNYTSIEYKNIREISLVQNLAQRIFKLGTIHIKTAAGTSFSGLKLRDIQNFEEVYDKLENNIKSYSVNANEKSSVIMEFKPQYKIMYALFCYAIPAAFILLCFTGEFLIPFIGFMIAFISMGIKHNCQKYKICSDKIEFFFSFLNKHKTTIFNEKLREIHLKKGFMQRIFKMGTFTLVTAASGGSGCKFYNVNETENINKIVQELIEKNSEV